jgi:hypothetical protein
MTRSRTIAVLSALALASCAPALVHAEGDWCPPDTVPATTVPDTTTTTPAPSTTVPPTTVPTTPGPADPIPEPDPNPDRCIDTNGDGVGSTRQSLMVCFTTAEAELWVTTVWAIAYRYQVSIPTANAMLIALLGG